MTEIRTSTLTFRSFYQNMFFRRNGGKRSTQGLFRHLAALRLCRVAQVGRQRAIPLPCRFEFRCPFLYGSEGNTLLESLPHWFGFQSRLSVKIFQ
jgi:hypothetical protein